MIADMIPWIAVVLMSVGCWSQVYRIHVHREVRDISYLYFIMLMCGYVILAIEAWNTGSNVFLGKQIAVIIPTTVILIQKYIHSQDKWHDDSDKICGRCKTELENGWNFCPSCGDSVDNAHLGH